MICDATRDDAKLRALQIFISFSSYLAFSSVGLSFSNQRKEERDRKTERQKEKIGKRKQRPIHFIGQFLPNESRQAEKHCRQSGCVRFSRLRCVCAAKVRQQLKEIVLRLRRNGERVSSR